MGTEHYCLRWNNHQSNLLGVFSQLLRDESLVDVTLSCSEGHSIRAHKVVLSACSSYFQSLFIDHPSRHPIVILKDVRFSELRTLIEFMYKGEVNVEYRQLSALLKTAESLKIKGLTEMTALSNIYTEDDQDHDLETMTVNPNTTIIPKLKIEQPDVEPTQSMTEATLLPLITPLVRYSDSSDRHPSSIEGSVKSFDCSRPETPEKLSQNEIPLNNTNENFLHDNSHKKTSSVSVSDHDHHSHVHNTIDEIVDEDDDDDDDDDFDASRTISSKVTNSNADKLLLNQPVAGPSGLAPIQNVPLSLKKENNWSSSSHNDEKFSNLSGIRTPTNQSSDTDLSPSQKTDYMETMSTHSSGSSTPVFALYPFPNVSNTIFEETSNRLLNLLHPNMFSGSSVSVNRSTKTELNSNLNPTKCNICSATFPSAWLLEQHMSLQHAYMKHREQNHRARLPADKLFTCDVCGMQFRYLKSFKKHRLNHTFERIHGRTMLYMNYHEKQSNSETPNICNNNTNNNRIGANSQIIRDTFFNAENCNDQVSSSNEAVLEENGAENDIEINEELKAVSNCERQLLEVKCEIKPSPPYLNINLEKTQVPLSAFSQQPPYQSQQLQHQQLHLQQTQQTIRDKRFICPFCGKCVRSKENLKLHVRKHTGERPFVCLFCGRAFGGKSDLTRHLRIHTGERPYHCEMCGKSFARADYLSKHLTTHVNKDDDFKKNFEYNSVVGGKF